MYGKDPLIGKHSYVSWGKFALMEAQAIDLKYPGAYCNGQLRLYAESREGGGLG